MRFYGIIDGRMDLRQITTTFTRNRENTPSTDWDGFIRGLRRINYTVSLRFEMGSVLFSFPEVMKQSVPGFTADIGEYFVKSLADDLIFYSV